MNDTPRYALLALPQAFFDEFGQSADDRVQDYARECVRAALSAQPASAQGEAVAWANFRHDPPSYVPFRTQEAAQESVNRSQIAATQEGPFSVAPLYAGPIWMAVPEEVERALDAYRSAVKEDLKFCTPFTDAKETLARAHLLRLYVAAGAAVKATECKPIETASEAGS